MWTRVTHAVRTMSGGHVCFGFFGKIDKVVSTIFTQSDLTFLPGFPCVGDSENKNLTSLQRELLLWHWKLSINMYQVQELMHERTFDEPLGQRTILPPITKQKNPSAWSCVIPVCQSCLLAHAVPGSGLPM
jgi:hypothetical protein